MIIWLASYPRSGNTFFRVLLKHYYGLDTYSIYDDKPLAERRVMWDIVGHKPRSMQVEEMEKADEIFFVKTHELPSDDLPAIYLVRDGRDALVSYAHYVLSFENRSGAGNPETVFQDTLHDLIAYNASFGGWGPNVMAWTKRAAPTAIVRFEELISSGDPAAIVQSALETLGVSERFPLRHDAPPSFESLHEKMPNFFREGKVGGWQDKISPDLLELFWKTHGDAMQFMGYSR